MSLPRSPKGVLEINRGCDPRSTRPPYPALSRTPAGCRPSLSLSVFFPAFSRAPAGRRGEEEYPH